MEEESGSKLRSQLRDIVRVFQNSNVLPREEKARATCSTNLSLSSSARARTVRSVGNNSKKKIDEEGGKKKSNEENIDIQLINIRPFCLVGDFTSNTVSSKSEVVRASSCNLNASCSHKTNFARVDPDDIKPDSRR